MTATQGAPRILLVGAAHDREALIAAVHATGAEIVAALADARGVVPSSVDLVVASVDDWPAEALPDLLEPLVALATAVPGGVVVTLREEQIDPVAAMLLGPGIDLLCCPDMPTLTAAIALALVRGSVAPSRVRENEAERLRRLNEEVARIAEVLARLTRQDRSSGSVADRGSDYRGPPAAVDVAAADIRKAIRARRLRDPLFAEGLFEDPAWDMLLDLYAAELEQGQVSVSSLCIAAVVPATTALRWIGRMTETGLLERRPDPFDRRRAFMMLTRPAREKMDRYFALLAQNHIAIA